MANSENLIPNSQRTPDELREMRRNGGIKSGQVRREKKIFQQAIAERMGFNDFNEMIDNLIERAKKNDKSFEILRDTLGQKPTENLQVNANIDSPYKELSLEELKKLAGEK